MNTPPPLAQPKSSGGGCLKAAGIGCLVIVIGLGVLGYVGYRFVKRQYTAVMERYEREGYKKVEGQFIEITDTIADPTIFVGQEIKIRKGSERGIALLCQSGTISGKVVGNVHFIGQTLTIDKDALLMRDLDVTAQTVNQFGTIEGKITGVYQTLNKAPQAEAAQP